MHLQKNTWMILEQTRKKEEKVVIKIKKGLNINRFISVFNDYTLKKTHTAPTKKNNYSNKHIFSIVVYFFNSVLIIRRC